MKIPTYARYDYVNRKASEFLAQYEINSFPIDPMLIIKQEQWGIQKYSDLMIAFNCSVEQVCKCLRSLDGYTMYDENNYTIAYNDVGKTVERIRFTQMHEIGHIYLNHLVDFEKTCIQRGGLTKAEDQVLENEANAFARNVLAPAPIVEKLQHKNNSALTQYYGLSNGAAKTRLDLFSKDKQSFGTQGLTPKIVEQFIIFINKKKCKTCNHSFISKSANYCPICGNSTIKWGDGELRYVKYLYETDNDGKLTICPTCKNEDVHMGDYCPICGRSLVNKCDYYEGNQYDSQNGCGKILAPNARFCPDCGLSSRFNQYQWLPDWQVEKDELEKMIVSDEIAIPRAQLEDLMMIYNDWGKIVQGLGGAMRPSFRETVVEPSGENCLCIVFSNSDNYAIGSRPTVVGKLEEYIRETYGKELYFKTRMRNTGEQTKKVYVCNDEAFIHVNNSVSD